MLGIDRDGEHHNTMAAAEAGVGAQVIDYRPDLGILLLGYLDGKTLCNDDFQRPEHPGQGGGRGPARCTRARGSGAASTCSRGSRPT